jgi:hypothetical protein
MKKLFLSILVICSLLGGNAYAIASFKNDSKPLNQSMNYFIKKGFKVVAQDTRGIRTAYVLKKEKDYVGCRTEGLSKKLICYKVTLIDND